MRIYSPRTIGLSLTVPLFLVKCAPSQQMSQTRPLTEPLWIPDAPALRCIETPRPAQVVGFSDVDAISPLSPARSVSGQLRMNALQLFSHARLGAQPSL